MSDSRKAIPRPYYKLVETANPSAFELHCGSEDFWVPHFEVWAFRRNLTDIYALDTLRRMVEAVNSYNPDRDKLARELAEDIISSHKAYYQPSQSMPMRESDWVNEIDKARQMLKLYEES